jgi:membrane protease YdiL (CAAX protease family)
MKLTYYFLAISILFALFNRNRGIACTCIAITAIVSLSEHVMTLTGAAYLSILALSVFFYFNYLESKRRSKYFVCMLIIALLAGFVLHYIPGFTNQLIVKNYWISAATRPCSIWLNFDMVFAALLVYTLSPLIFKENTLNWPALQQTLLIFCACAVVILGPAIFSGYVRLDPKIPAILPIWAVNNLVFVCFGEEVIYRGFLQTTLKSYFPSSKVSTILAIVIASIIFGLRHYHGGVSFICLAAIAGLFYGYAYERTNRIFCAMMVHFSLNLTHLLVFTYPA